MLSEENHPKVSVELLRHTAAQLFEENHLTPTLRQVAERLGCAPEYCRLVVNHAREQGPISWQELNIQTGIITNERQQLADVLHLLTSERAKIVAIHRVLQMATDQSITTRQAQLLVYSITQNQAYRDGLDLPFAELMREEPKVISRALHTYRRERHKHPGLLEAIEEGQYQWLKGVKTDLPQGRRSRQFLSDCITFFRDLAERRILSIFLERPAPPPHIAQIVGAAVRSVLDSTWPPELVISPSHMRLMRNLIDDKSAGVFSTLKEFSARREVDASGIFRAFSGHRSYLGLPDKVAAGALRVGDISEDAIRQAMTALRKSATLTAEQSGLLGSVLDKIECAQDVPSEVQRNALRYVFERKLAGKSVLLGRAARALGISESAMYTAIEGREGARGARERVNQVFQAMSVEDRRLVIGHYFPFDERSYRKLFSTLARAEPRNEKEQARKEQLLRVVEAFVQEHVIKRFPRIVEIDGGRRTDRPMQQYEVATLVRAFLGEYRGNGKRLRKELAQVLHSRHELQISEKVFRLLLFGKKSKALVIQGGISKFVKEMEKIAPDIEMLAKKNDRRSLQQGELPSYLDNSPLLGWAQEILRETDGQKRMRLTAECCATRPHTFREIVRDAQLGVVSPRNLLEVALLGELRRELARASLAISDSRAVDVLMKAQEVIYANEGEIVCGARSLIKACLLRAAATQHVSEFLHHIYARKKWTNGLVFIEEIAQLAYGKESERFERNERRYYRRCYDGFLLRTFGTLFVSQLSVEDKCDIATIVARATTEELRQSESDVRARRWIEGFYAKYSVEAVIRRFCSHLIRGPENPRGLPYSELIEIANNAVFEASRTYHPEEYAAAGKPVASFNTHAVNMIRWNALHGIRRLAQQLKHTPVRLDDPVSSEDDSTIGSMIANESEPEDLELQVKAEQLMRALNRLTPLAKRIMELRFSLGRERGDVDDLTLDEIAKTLKREKLSERVFSREYIRQIISASVISLRVQTYSGTAPEWVSYFSAIDSRETPRPIMVDARGAEMRMSEQLVFRIAPDDIGKKIVFNVDRVFRNPDRQYEVIVRSQDVATLEELGAYEILVDRGAVVTCERLD